MRWRDLLRSPTRAVCCHTRRNRQGSEERDKGGKGESHSGATPGLARTGMLLGEADSAATQGEGRPTDDMRNNGAKSTL